MKKSALALVFILQSSLAWAGCSLGALPFQLQNFTVADATQVMANFNQLVTGAGANCAAAGANNDITSLGALATPLSPAQGGTYTFLGGTSSGTNAVVISSTSPVFSLVTGYRVTFFAGGTSTAQATLNVASTGVKNVFRRTQSGVFATQGGELIAGNTYTVIYDGTEFIIDGELVIVAEMRDFAGAVAPPGWLLADGTTYNQTTFPALFAVIGQTYGGSVGTFAVPDTRGRVLAGLDNFGSAIGAANRLTNVATGCGSAFTTLGSACTNANQSHTQVTAEVGAHNHAITDPGHTHTGVVASTGGQNIGSAAAPAVTIAGTSASSTTGITINNSAAATPMPIVNPNLGVLKIIRF